mgnify:CR=1 FL=1
MKLAKEKLIKGFTDYQLGCGLSENTVTRQKGS